MSVFLSLAVIAHYGLALFVVARILMRRKEPTAMVAWIFAVLVIPVFGMLLYWLMGSNRLYRKVSRRRRRVAHLRAMLRHWAAQGAGEDATQRVELPEDLAGIAALGERLTGVPPTTGNEIELLEEADATYAALESALRAARHHIHLQYYIWQDDETGRAFRDLVSARAQDGIECRLLLDAVGCWRLSRRFLKPLVDAGVSVAFFLPLHPIPRSRRWSLHLRNHRKIAVVDGQVSFIGSQNIGDEYRGRLAALSPWYDTHVRISGPATLFVQQTFAEDWYFAVRERLDSDAYFGEPTRAGDCTVQMLPTGPDQPVTILDQVIFAAVSSAKEVIRIATPYFSPDPTVRMALAYACNRGVQVKLVLPTRSDMPFMLWAARSFYAELLEYGVEIFEFEGGVIHSKLATVDDRWALVGSANMDARSFRLSFEITAAIYDTVRARELSASIDRFCAAARQVTLREVWQKSWPQKLGEGVARLFAPVL